MNDLVDPDEPLDDGTLPVDPDGNLVAVLTDSEAADKLNRVYRSLDELPDIPRSVNPVNVVLCYEMFGLDDFNISVAVSLPIDTVIRIRNSDVYTQMKEAVVKGLIENARTAVQGVLSTHALGAAEQLATEMRDAGRATDRITAASQVLDRSGHTAQHVLTVKKSFENELRINFVKQEREFEGEAIDIDVEDVN